MTGDDDLTREPTSIAVKAPPGPVKHGTFGAKKALQQEVAALRSFIDGLGYGELQALSGQLLEMRTTRGQLDREIVDLLADRERAEGALATVREELILQEVGVYDYHHRVEDSVDYKQPLAELQSQMKAMAMKDGGAVSVITDWTVNGSKVEGRKMVRETSKLMLRAYNAEADRLVQTMRPYKLDSAVDRINKSKEIIAKLGRSMQIEISPTYHRLRIEEMKLTADYLAKLAEEKEAEREEKARLREEAQARKEFEAEKARLLKEQAHYANVIEQLRANGDLDGLAAAEVHLKEIADAIRGVEEREANIRAGYVYVISNVGAFGERMVKIGMTRRLEPMERIRELGDASVPFRYDVHALFFSNDAVGLETKLHHALSDQRVNRVNNRREFFYATPKEVETLLKSVDGSMLSFVEAPEAVEWFQSENERRAIAPADATT